MFVTTDPSGFLPRVPASALAFNSLTAACCCKLDPAAINSPKAVGAKAVSPPRKAVVNQLGFTIPLKSPTDCSPIGVLSKDLP